MKTSIHWLIAASLSMCVASAMAEDTPAPPPDTSAPAASNATEQPVAAAQTKTARRGANDRLDLDTTVVTGNRELPKVLYIVPWKKANLGDLPGQPFNTLLDEALTPVDRDVFRREVTYYDAVAAGRGAGDTPAPAAAPTGKKQ